MDMIKWRCRFSGILTGIRDLLARRAIRIWIASYYEVLQSSFAIDQSSLYGPYYCQPQEYGSRSGYGIMASYSVVLNAFLMESLREALFRRQYGESAVIG